MIKFDHSQPSQEDAIKFENGSTLKEVVAKIGATFEPLFNRESEMKVSEKVEAIINSDLTREELAVFLQKTIHQSLFFMQKIETYEFLHGPLNKDNISSAVNNKVTNLLTDAIRAETGSKDMVIATGDKPDKKQIIKDVKEILGEDAEFHVEESEIGMEVSINKKHQTPENLERINDYFKGYTNL